MNERKEGDPIWGPAPTPERFDKALRTNDKRLREQVKTAIDLSYESQLFANELGIEVDKLWELTRQGKVGSFLVEGMSFYPVWQINNGKLLEGLDEVVGNFYGFEIHMAHWGVKPNSLLGGKAPADCLKDGQLPAVIEAIKAANPNNRM